MKTAHEGVDPDAVSKMSPQDRVAFMTKMREQGQKQFEAVKTAVNELFGTLDDAQKAKAQKTPPRPCDSARARCTAPDGWHARHAPPPLSGAAAVCGLVGEAAYAYGPLGATSGQRRSLPRRNLIRRDEHESVHSF